MSAEKIPLMDKLRPVSGVFRSRKFELSTTEEKDDSCIKYRYVLTVLGFFAFANVYTMRVNFSVAVIAMVKSSERGNETNVTIDDSCEIPTSENETYFHEESYEEGEFSWSTAEQNLIQSCFFYGFIVTNIIGGRIAELLGTKWIVGGGVMLSSIVTIASPFIANLGISWFCASRVFVGLGVGLIYPAIHCSLGQWYPQKERGLMYSVIHSGARFGTAVTFPLSAFLCSSSARWPSAFYSFGAFGIAWCILWCLLMYDKPEDHPYISDSELNYILSHKHEEGQAKEKIPIPWLNLLTSVPVWATAIALFGTEWGFNVLISDLPTYMSHVLHFELTQNGGLDALPYVCDMIIQVLSGVIADWILAKKLLSVTATRILFSVLGAFLPAACLLIITFLGCNRAAIVGVMILAVGFGGARIPGSAVAIVDMAPNFSGTIMGICNGISQLSGVISLPIVGILTSHEGRKAWNNVFYVAIGVYVVTAVVFIFFGTAQLQHWSTTRNPDPPRWIAWIKNKLGL